jgi:hypothetical protein
MRLIDIDGRAVYVVYCWRRFEVTIVGVTDSQKDATRLRKEFIEAADDPEWERVSGERRNNTMIERHFINGGLKVNA